MATTVFDRVANIINEVGREKQAAQQKQGMKDPGGMEGQSTHESVVPEDKAGERPASEGAQSADNSKEIKDQEIANVDNLSDVTPGSAPKYSDVQQGQGVEGKATGEDTANERTNKGDKEDPGDPGAPKFQGGTNHPASGDFGEKYSQYCDRAWLQNQSLETLYKLSAELNTELAADVGNGYFNKSAMTTKTHCNGCHQDYEGEGCPRCSKTGSANGAPRSATAKAAAAGYNAAAQAAKTEKQAAAEMVAAIIKEAHFQADLVADHLRTTLADLEKGRHKRAVDEDPTGGAAQGEDHGSEESPEGGEAEGDGDGDEMGGGMPPAGGGGEDLLAAMGGGGGAPGGDPMGGGMGGDPMAGGMEGGMGGPPPELGAMGGDDALQQLAMALVELGIPVENLAAMAGPGEKMAADLKAFKAAGKFRFEEAKTASQRKVRNYMKGYLRELSKRNK